jgi:hypothetical protein
MWRAVYLFMLPTLLRKLQVFSEWNLELLFPRDMTQLHFALSNWPRDDAESGAGGAGGQTPEQHQAASRHPREAASR